MVQVSECTLFGAQNAQLDFLFDEVHGDASHNRGQSSFLVNGVHERMLLLKKILDSKRNSSDQVNSPIRQKLEGNIADLNS